MNLKEMTLDNALEIVLGLFVIMFHFFIMFCIVWAIMLLPVMILGWLASCAESEVLLFITKALMLITGTISAVLNIKWTHNTYFKDLFKEEEKKDG